MRGKDIPNIDIQRESILDQVRSYAEASLATAEFRAGETPVPVSGEVLDAADFAADPIIEFVETAER